jgi:hypothetical protein
MVSGQQIVTDDNECATRPAEPELHGAGLSTFLLLQGVEHCRQVGADLVLLGPRDGPTDHFANCTFFGVTDVLLQLLPRGSLQNWIPRLIVSAPSLKASINRGCATFSRVFTLVTLRAPTAAASATSWRTSMRSTSGKFAKPLYFPRHACCRALSAQGRAPVSEPGECGQTHSIRAGFDGGSI